MVTKNGVRTFADLIRYSEERATRSLKRNDPIAMAYWQESGKWARQWDGSNILENAEELPTWCRHFLRCAKSLLRREPMQAALNYSRAKWLVIMGRNRGIVMSPKETGVNLAWLRAKVRRVS